MLGLPRPHVGGPEREVVVAGHLRAHVQDDQREDHLLDPDLVHRAPAAHEVHGRVHVRAPLAHVAVLVGQEAVTERADALVEVEQRRALLVGNPW
jgi:hypothetical protein